MPVNQQVVCNDINGIGSDVGAHGDFRVPGPTLGGVNPHLDSVKYHSSHNNLEINHRALVGVSGGTAQTDNRPREQHKNNAQYNPHTILKHHPFCAQKMRIVRVP